MPSTPGTMKVSNRFVFDLRFLRFADNLSRWEDVGFDDSPCGGKYVELWEKRNWDAEASFTIFLNGAVVSPISLYFRTALGDELVWSAWASWAGLRS